MPCRLLFDRRTLNGVALALLVTGCSAPAPPEDEQAIKAVVDLGGKVVRQENLPGQPATAVEFPKATDAGLKEVARLKQLQSLTLAGTEVSDAGLKELVGLDRLANLDLSGTRVTDAGLKDLATVKNLSRLVLTGTATTDAGVADLQKSLPYCHIER